MTVIQKIRKVVRGRRRFREVHADETGGIVTGWLVQLVVIMAVIAVVGYEVISVAITAINLDDQAREVAIEAREVYRDTKRLDRATERAETAAETRDIELVEVSADDDNVYVRVRDTAGTLIIHRISALDNVTHPTAQGRARWRP